MPVGQEVMPTIFRLLAAGEVEVAPVLASAASITLLPLRIAGSVALS